MARKPKTGTDRFVAICGWGLMLAIGIAEMLAKTHGAAGFSALLMVVVSVLMLVVEIKDLIEEPSER